MKKRDLGITKETVKDPRDPERRKVTKMIGALTILGMGIGVNLDEVFADEKTPEAKAFKVEQPVTDMSKVKKPSADHTKHLDSAAAKNKSTSSGAKTFKSNKMQPKMPAKPGVSVVKPVPANMLKIHTGQGKGEKQLQNVTGTK